MTSSVIIPAFNSGKYVAAAIDSALAQQDVSAEVIVVDDGSTDGTRESVAKYGGRVTYVWQPNGGVSAARNHGLRICTGTHVLFLDADDRLEPDALSKLLNEASTCPDCVIFGNVRVVDEAANCHCVLRRPDLAGERPLPTNRIFGGGAIPPSAFLIPTSLARRVGGFSPTLSYAADMHFLMKCGLYASFRFVDHAVLNYLKHPGAMSNQRVRAVTDVISAKVEIANWAAENGFEWNHSQDSQEMLVGMTEASFYAREWDWLCAALTVAREKGFKDTRLKRLARLSKYPKFIFAIKDRIDLLVAQRFA